MSTSSTRKGRRKLVGVLVTLAAAFGLFLSLGGTASASVGCTFQNLVAPASVNIVINASVPPANNDITVKRSGQLIFVNGSPCSDGFGNVATVINTDQINVYPAPAGAFGDDNLNIDLSAGPFSPGLTPEGAATLNEIEWFVDLGSGNNTVTVTGSNAAEGIAGGQDGLGTTFWDGIGPVAPNGDTFVLGPQYGDVLLNLNAGVLTDQDADVWIAATGSNGTAFIPPAGPFTTDVCLAEDCLLSALILNLDGGDNTVFLKGGDGTGAALCDQGNSPFTIDTDGLVGIIPNPVPVFITTGSGNDNIIGSECSDVIQPGGGNDFVDGNGPDFGQACAFQDDILGEWVPVPFNFGILIKDIRFAGCFTSGDVVDFSNLDGPANITINEDGSLTITGTPGIPGTFVGVEHVIGTKGDDTINGNSQSNLLGGAGGNDTINGNGGDDVLDGGDGNDILAGDLGNDVEIGGAGDDTFNENDPVDKDGNPTYGLTGNGADPMDGGAGTDTVDYSKRGRADGRGNVVVYLGLISTFNDGADPNHDGLTNEYDDVFFTTENVVTGSNDDLVSANFTNNRANNVIADNGGNDCVEGGPGNDQFQQGTAPQGADVILGDTGTDLANYGADSTPVVGPAAQTAGRTDAVAVSLDGVANDGDIATNEGDMVGGLSVSCRPATIIVNPPIGIIDLFFEQGILNQISFTDTPIPGPAPNCFVVFDRRAQQGQGGFDFCDNGEQVGGDASGVVDVENVNGGAGNDILNGNNVGNVLNGQGGNDQIAGNGSSDQLNGGDGDDTINPGSGNDAVDGGAGTNTVDYASSGAGGVGVTVNLTTGTASGDGNDTIKSIQNVNGSSFADAITGDDNANALWGRGGNDAIQAKGGDDTVFGGAGTDQIASGSGADKVSGQDGNDAIQGGADNDWLQGGNGRDTILGQKGNDKLYGNAQPDFLNGGPGNDLCKPGSPGLARGDVAINCEV